MVSSTPRPLDSQGLNRYPFYTRLGRPQGPSGRVRKISHSKGFSFCSYFLFFLYLFIFFQSLSSIVYFISSVLMSLIILKHATQTSVPPVGFEPTIPASDQTQTLALERSTTGIGFDPRTVQFVTSRNIDSAIPAHYRL